MADKRAHRRRFTTVEELEALLRAGGWPLEYRQLERGRFSSTVKYLEANDCFVLEEQSNRTVEVVSRGPAETFLVALVDGDRAIVNGRSMNSECIFVQRPGSNVRAILPSRLRITRVGMPARHFKEISQSIASGVPALCGSSSLFSAEPPQIERIRDAIRGVLITSPGSHENQAEAVFRMVADAVSLQSAPGTGPHDEDLHCNSALRALDKARAYVDSNLEHRTSVMALSRSAGTTIRTLERIFAREVGISPQQYIKARRLDACRRRLLAADGEGNTRIAQVARHFGFTHLGRFSGDYRRQFGEYPRDTLGSH